MNALRLIGRRFVQGSDLLAMGGIALSIAISVASYTALDRIVLKSLPYREADRLVAVRSQTSGVSYSNGLISDFELQQIARQPIFAAATAASNSRGLISTEAGGLAETINASTVSRSFFQTIGQNALAGRVFGESDHVRGAPLVAVLGRRLSVRLFGSDQALGRVVRFASDNATVVGIAPDTFDLPVGTELWLASRSPVGGSSQDKVGYLRLAPTTPHRDVEAAIRSASEAVRLARPNSAAGRILVSESLRRHVVGRYEDFIPLLFGGGLVLVAVSLANVLVFGAVRRAAESATTAIRLALGASFRVLLLEASGRGVVGCACGWALGLAGARVLTGVAAAGSALALPRFDSPALTSGSVALSGAIAGLFLAACIATAWPNTRTNGAAGLLATRSAGSNRVIRRRLRLGQAAGAMALVPLLAVGTWVSTSAWRLAHADMGFSASDLAVLCVRFPERIDRATQLERLEFIAGKLRELSVVRSVSLATTVPFFGDSDPSGAIGVANMAPDVERPRAKIRVVDQGFFATLQTAMIRGTGFSGTEGAESEPVAIVNATFANRFLRSGQDVGQHIGLQGFPAPGPRIIGVVSDIRMEAATSELAPSVYLPLGLSRKREMVIAVSAHSSQGRTMMEAARRTIREAYPDVALEVESVDRLEQRSLFRERVTAQLLALIAAIAGIIASIGTYAVASYTGRAARGELALRAALGATTRRLVLELCRSSVLPVLVGFGIGMTLTLLGAGALLAEIRLGRGTQAVLASVSFIVVAGLGFLSAIGPARRNAKVDPSDLLRR